MPVATPDIPKGMSWNPLLYVLLSKFTCVKGKPWTYLGIAKRSTRNTKGFQGMPLGMPKGFYGIWLKVSNGFYIAVSPCSKIPSFLRGSHDPYMSATGALEQHAVAHESWYIWRSHLGWNKQSANHRQLLRSQGSQSLYLRFAQCKD